MCGHRALGFENTRRHQRGWPGAQRACRARKAGHLLREPREQHWIHRVSLVGTLTLCPVLGGRPACGLGSLSWVSPTDTQLECARLTGAHIPQGPGIPTVGRGHSTRQLGLWVRASRGAHSGLEDCSCPQVRESELLLEGVGRRLPCWEGQRYSAGPLLPMGPGTCRVYVQLAARSRCLLTTHGNRASFLCL